MDFSKTDSVRWLAPDEAPQWDRFVEQHPAGLIYHTSLWKSALEGAFPHIKGHFLALTGPSGEIAAGLALYTIRSWLLGVRLVSIPFASLGDPLVRTPGDLTRLMEHAHGPSSQARRLMIEIRAVRNPANLDRLGFAQSARFKHHYIDLNRPPGELLSTFSRTAVRRMITKAGNERVVVRKGSSNEDLEKFYSLFVQNRRRLKLPPIPFKFFSSLWKSFHPNHLSLLLAYRDEEAIGGVLGLKYKTHYLLEYAGERPGVQRLGVNQLLYWEAIKDASAQGCTFFSLGRTSPFNQGLLDYKRHWGTVEEDLPILVLDPRGAVPSSRPESRWMYRMARSIAGRLPMPLFDLMGRFCFSHWG